MSTISTVISEAFVFLPAYPLSMWNYGVMAVLSFIGGTCFWIQYRKLDIDNNHFNILPVGEMEVQAKDIKDWDEHHARRIKM